MLGAKDSEVCNKRTERIHGSTTRRFELVARVMTASKSLGNLASSCPLPYDNQNQREDDFVDGARRVTLRQSASAAGDDDPDTERERR